jgi:hypothetical protein
MGKAPAFALAGDRKNPEMIPEHTISAPARDSGDKRSGPGAGERSSPRFLSFCLYELGELPARYVLAAVREGEGNAPGIRWFSQETLPLISIAEIKAVLSPVTTVRPKI